ncbi:MAG: nodulation protein NfeD [Lautropia sp.]
MAAPTNPPHQVLRSSSSPRSLAAVVARPASIVMLAAVVLLVAVALLATARAGAIGVAAAQPAGGSAAAPAPAAAAAPAANAVATRQGPIIDMTIDGAIGPATAEHLRRALAHAADVGASALLVRLDTPGGLDTSMREMIRMILAAPLPVITYVHPAGARAASAGTFLLYASHFAAMSPGTNVGAATPVAIGGGGGGKEGSGKEGSDRPAADPMTSKAVNDAVAYLRSLAALRGRDADWAERAVRDAASLPADAALAQRVVDVVATDVDDLLRQLDGRSTRIAERTVTIRTAGAERVEYGAGWRVRALAAITHPHIALLLVMIGFYGLFFEFTSPGAIYPGTIGAVCLLLGLYGLAALPISWAGAGLALLGLALLIAEAFVPSFGVLGIGGLVALIAGLALLIDTDDIPGFEVGWPFIAGLALAAAGLALITARAAFRSATRPITAGAEAMLDEAAEVVDWNGLAGHVFVHGERWRARASESLEPGQRVRVLAIDGLTAVVAPAGAAVTSGSVPYRGSAPSAATAAQPAEPVPAPGEPIR